MSEDTKKFVKKAVFFLIILAIVFLLINQIYINNVFSKKQGTRKEVIYQDYIKSLQNKTIAYAFFGSSHVRDGIDPMYINSSFNLASSAESYVQTYYKLNRTLNKDKIKIDYIFLELDMHTFSSILLRDSSVLADLENYHNYMTYQQIASLSHKSIPEIFLRTHFPVLGDGKSLFKKIEPTPIYLGWTENNNSFLTINRTEDVQERVDLHFKDQELISNLTLEYFQKTVLLAKENNLTIIFVKYPTSKEYNQELAKRGINKTQYYNIILSDLNKTTRNYKILDYQESFFNHEDYFGDCDHLNSKGAEVLTKMIYQNLTLNTNNNKNH
ncbi:MAG: hypothetical protein WC796_01055 [Candidatus Pacearchaeota archaeon]|jgi:hypothetical protein